jgi:uncharacterized protein YqjF (DUF2071 family)
LSDAQLAVLVACHHRGPLTLDELSTLLGPAVSVADATSSLREQGLLESHGGRLAATQAGRYALDRVLEEIEGHLAPDDPVYVARYRREAPTLPFDANTVWAEAVCLNIRVRPEALRPLIPEVFDLDLYEGWAWVSLTASRLKDFGVGWLPAAMRMNFYQSTYRAHVRYTDFRGRSLKGCYFVRSETNSAMMSLTANLLPEFRAHQCSTYPILMARQHDHLVLTVDTGNDPAGKVVLVLDTARPLVAMPPNSVFPTLLEARAFIVDFHDAFSYDPDTREVFFLKIDRGEWHLQVFEPVDHYLGYVSAGPFPPGAAELDSLFYFRNTPYRWLPLVKERRKHERPAG